MPDEEVPTPQFVYAEEAKQYGIPVHPEAVGVELHGFTLAQVQVPFRPILDRVLIRKLETPKASDDFNVPDKYRQHSNDGVVVALGDGVVLGGQFKPLTDFLSVGDKVVYGEYTAERWQQDGEELWICRIQDIRGVQRG